MNRNYKKMYFKLDSLNKYENSLSKLLIYIIYFMFVKIVDA